MAPKSDNEINEKVGILLRREIEAKLIMKFKDYLSGELGTKKTRISLHKL